MKAIVDKETCISCELCPNICPEIFYMDDDGKAESKKEELSGEIAELAEEAEDQCPVNAILVE